MNQRNINYYFMQRKAELEDIIKHENDPEKHEEKINELEESILSIDVSKTYDILLSWGGPSDGFKVDTDKDDELTSIRYWFADWFTYDEIKLQEEEKDNFLSAYGYLLEGLGIKY